MNLTAVLTTQPQRKQVQWRKADDVKPNVQPAFLPEPTSRNVSDIAGQTPRKVQISAPATKSAPPATKYPPRRFAARVLEKAPKRSFRLRLRTTSENEPHVQESRFTAPATKSAHHRHDHRHHHHYHHHHHHHHIHRHRHQHHHHHHHHDHHHHHHQHRLFLEPITSWPSVSIPLDLRLRPLEALFGVSCLDNSALDPGDPTYEAAQLRPMHPEVARPFPPRSCTASMDGRGSPHRKRHRRPLMS